MTKQVQRRRGTATQHTSFTGAEGEISVNTTNKSVHVHDGVTAGGFEAARADLGNVSDASLNTALAGNTLSSLTITSADINGGTIDGTVIGGTTPAAVTGTTLTATTSATLQHSASTKLATTSTGVDVTGTVTADGLTGTDASAFVINNDTADGADNKRLVLQSGGGSFSNGRGAYIALSGVEATNAGQLLLNVGNANGSKVQMNNRSGAAGFMFDGTTNDISFYEDTGTTPKFFWDASAEALVLSNSTGTDYNNGALKIGSGEAVGDRLLTLGVNSAGEYGYLQSVKIGNQYNALSLNPNGGNVGIGKSSPAMRLDIVAANNSQLRIDSSDANDTTFFLDYNGGGATNRIRIRNAAGDLAFNVSNTTEAMRIDSSGNLLVGKTSTSGAVVGLSLEPIGIIKATRSSNISGFFNREDSDGNIVSFAKDDTTVGSIGSDGGAFMYLGTGDTGLRFIDSTVDRISPYNTSTGAQRDNAIDLGEVSARFDDIYATNGTIQTSDANEKQQIAEFTAAEMDAAKAISKLFKTFKWNDSVAEKGDDARIHSGVIAQDVEAAMTAAGLDAGKYAFFISSTWWESTEVIPAVEEVLDEEGNVVTEAQQERTVTHTHETAEEAPEGAVEKNRKGIRYPQLLSFIGAATEQRLASIEARLDALETV